MATKKISAKRTLKKTDVARYAEEYVSEKAMLDAIKQRVDEKKAALVAALTQFGETDEKGNVFLDVGIEGCARLKHELRRSETLNLDRIEAWLKSRGLWDEFSTTVRIVDEEKVLAAAFEGKQIPKATMRSFYDINETMAFKVLK